jgi:hypothetical protein
LTLQKTTQHIFLLLNSYHLLFLLLRNPLLESLNLFPLKLIPLRLSFSVTHPRLILIDILQLVLILHEMIVVLLIDRIFLRFNLIANQHLLIIFFLLPLFLLSLSLPHLLALGKYLHRSSLLLLHLLLPPYLILLHRSAVVLVHLPLLLHVFPPFVLASPPSLLTELEILISEVLLKIVLVIALLVDLFLQIVLRPNNFFELSALGVEHFLPSFELMQ